MTHRYRNALLLLQAVDAAQTPHSGRSLRDHLLGTHALLTYWGADEDICLAGLLHSIYRTRSGAVLLAHPPQRSEVVDAVGEHVGALIDAYMGSGLVQQEPPRLHQPEQDGVSVSLIMLANLVEQTIHLPRTCLHPLIAHVKAYRDTFPQQVNEWIATFIPLVANAIEDR